MGKDRNKKNKQKSIQLQVPQGFSAEEWSHIIARAIEEAEQNRRAEVNKRQEEEQKVWQQALGLKDYSKEKGLKRWIMQRCNIVKAFLKLSFMPRNKIAGDRVTFSLMQTILSSIFGLLGKVLLFAAMCLVVVPMIFWIIGNPIDLTQTIYSILWGALIFALSRLFRVASIELEKIEDRNYLFSLFACVMSIISLVVALVRR